MRLFWPYLFLLFLLPQPSWANTDIDSLSVTLRQWENKAPDRDWAKTKHALGMAWHNAGQFAKALTAFESTLEYAESTQDKALMADCILGLAKSHQRLNNFSKALDHYYDYLDSYKKVINKKQQGFAYSQVSDVYQNLGDNQKSFDIQMQALQIFEEAADTNGIASSTYSLATIFFYQSRFDAALEYYEKAFELGEVVDNGRLIYSCLAAIGSVYERKGEVSKGLSYNKKALAMAKEIDYPFGIAYAYGNLGADYWLVGDYKRAEYYYLKSLRMKEGLGDKWGAIGGNFGLGATYLSWGFPDQAIAIIGVGLEMASNIDSKPRLLEGYELMSKAYNTKNDPENAYLYLSKYVILKDSVINEKTVEEMGQSQRRYEIQKREQEIKLLKKGNELFEKNQQVQSLRNYFFCSAILLLLVLSGWFFNRNKLQKEVNHLLEDKNLLLNAKNEEIEVKNKQLAVSNENLSQFAYVASHDLKEPLRMINSYTRLLEKKYTGLFDNNAKEFMFFITDAVDRMSTLLDDLLEFSRAGDKKFTDDLLDFNDVILIVESNLKVQLSELNATLKMEAKDLPLIKVNRTQLVQLVQNLVSNGVKFRGERDPVVTINCQLKDEKMVFSIADNGIGISEENKSKVFEMFRRLHTRDEYAGTGIGLATCKRIVDHYGGDIWVESTLGEGSTFYFTLPATVVEYQTQPVA